MDVTMLVTDAAWLADARRRRGQPPKQPREWKVTLDLPEGQDPLVSVPDPQALAALLAPEGWVAREARVFSGRGCTMAPRWRGWRIEMRFWPVSREKQTQPRWFLTDSACNNYVAIRRWEDTEESMERAEQELERIMPDATQRTTDREGRMLYRSPRSHGSLRWIVDPKPRPPDSRPRVIWVGRGAPPKHLWGDVEPEPWNAEWVVTGEGKFRTWTLTMKDGTALAKVYAGQNYCSYLVDQGEERLFNNTCVALTEHQDRIREALYARYRKLAELFGCRL